MFHSVRRRFGSLVMLVCASAGVHAQLASGRAEVVFSDRTRVSVEIADTEDERQRGLMFRKTLPPNEGMLFVFEEVGFYPFWMKNTPIPLDMIWLDPQGRVVSVAHSVPPCKADPCPTYPPTGNALYVVEVESGFAKRHGVKAGDVLELKGVVGGRRGRKDRSVRLQADVAAGGSRPLEIAKDT